MSIRKKTLLLTSPREQGWIENVSNSVVRGLHTFIDEMNKDGECEYAVSTVDKLDFHIDSDGVVIYDRYNGNDLRDYDIVHLRNVTLFGDYARAISLYMTHHGKHIIDESDGTLPEYGKLSQMVLFALNGLPVPKTWASWHVADAAKYYMSQSGVFPFILKANDGIKGHDNYLVQTPEMLDEIAANNPDKQFVAQNYIPNDKDYRVLWLGDNPLIFSRSATDGSHLNNTSRGGESAEMMVNDFAPEALAIARKAADLTRRVFSGADVMQNSDTGEWYVLEVNANPALTSGDLLDKKRVLYKKMIGEIL